MSTPLENSMYYPEFKPNTRRVLLSVNDLEIDRTYQRPPVLNGKMFDPKAMRDLEVANRNDGLKRKIVDGGHRWLMVIAAGYTHVWCCEWDSTGPEEEAQRFHRLNDMKNLSRNKRVNAKLVGCEPETVEAERIANMYGFSFSTNNKKFAANGKVKGQSACEKAYACSPAALACVFELVTRCWPCDDDAVSARWFNGLAGFVTQHVDDENFSLDRCVEVMKPTIQKPSERTPLGWFNRAKVTNTNWNIPDKMEETFREAYNEGLPPRLCLSDPKKRPRKGNAA